MGHDIISKAYAIGYLFSYQGAALGLSEVNLVNKGGDLVTSTNFNVSSKYKGRDLVITSIGGGGHSHLNMGGDLEKLQRVQ